MEYTGTWWSCRAGCAALMVVMAGDGALAGISPGCIPQDLNGSGGVDGGDLGLLLAEWGDTGGFGPADFDSSGKVDGADLGVLLAAWGPVPPIACVEVTGVSPASGAPGTEVKIVGAFPRGNPDDYCAVAMSPDGSVIPFDVVSVSEDSMVVIVGPYGPDAQPGHIMIGLGDGTSAVPDGPPNAIYGGETWSWAADGPGMMSDVVFSPDNPGAPIAGSFYGTLVGGKLCVTIMGDCPPGTAFELWPRAHHYGNGTPNDPYVGYDCFIPCVQVDDDLGEFDCAKFICEAIKAAYLAHVPPIVIDCDVSTVAGGTKLTLSLPGLAIDWGMFNIVTLPPYACEPQCNPLCPCDVNGDGVIDVQDLAAIQAVFGQTCPAGAPCCEDLNGDGVIDLADLNIFANGCVFGPCPVPCNPDCPCDVNGDGVVDQQDLIAIEMAFGPCIPGVICCTDLNGDGKTDGLDIEAWFACNGGCTPQGGPCDLCDVNGDGVVNLFDREFIVASFGPCDVDPCCADLDGDGDVDQADVAVWQANCG